MRALLGAEGALAGSGGAVALVCGAASVLGGSGAGAGVVLVSGTNGVGLLGALGASVAAGAGTGAGLSLRSTRGATVGADWEGAEAAGGEAAPALGVLDCSAAEVLASGPGAAVLEVRVVASLAGLFWAVEKDSVTLSELVTTEGSKSTTVAVVSAVCL